MLKFLQSLLVLAAIVIAIVLSWPSLLGLQREMFISQIVAFRNVLIVSALIAALALLILGLIFRSIRSLGTSLALVLIVFAAFNGLLVFNNGLNNPDAPSLQNASPEEVTVLAWNTLGNKPGAEEIARLAINSNAQIISLPETTKATAQEVADRLTAAGMPMQLLHRSLSQSAAAKSTGLLISKNLGSYHLVDTEGDTSLLPTLIAVSETGPKIIAVHAVAPLPDFFEGWKRDLEWLAGQCNDPNTIMAGDFNATLDHFIGLGTDGATLGLCQDAAKVQGGAAFGTWPSSLPGQLGIAIDHIMAGDDWTASYFRVVTELDHTGSDHRPLVARFIKN